MILDIIENIIKGDIIIMNHKWENYFDTESEYWKKIQKIYEEHKKKISEANKGKHWKLVGVKRVWY